MYPADIFGMDTEEPTHMGYLALHILGIVYTFVALAVVCDEFFVPALEVMIERWFVVFFCGWSCYGARGAMEKRIVSAHLILLGAAHISSE
jgi:sodium/potassium/calcium exchanger 2